MFSSPLCASLVALVTFAVAVSAIPSLSVKTSTPSINIEGLENLKVTTTISNTGDETLKLLNDPRGTLNSFPENSFSITNTVGSRPSFNGAKVKYNPAYAAGLDNPSVFTVLDPGASFDVTHDLSTAYNFTLSGAGDYFIEPSNLFTYVDSDGTPKDLRATVEDVAKIKLSGNLAVSRVYEKRIDYASCTVVEQTLAEAAAVNAEDYARESYSYLEGLWGSSPRYETWFGIFAESHRATVENHFRLIRNNELTDFTYDCSCSEVGSMAYVFPDQFGTIYLCGAFWGAPVTGSDSRAGTLIHESSHFVAHGWTLDWVYGQEASKELAKNNPDRAIANGDNYQYFAENTPALT